MSGLMQFLREATLCGSVLIAVLLLLRAGLRKYVAPRFWYGLWLAAAVCLLIPLRFASPFSVMNAVDGAQNPGISAEADKTASQAGRVPAEELPGQVDRILSEQNSQTGAAVPDAAGRNDADQPEESSGSALWNWQTLLFGLWAVGALGTFFYIAGSNLRFAGRIRRSMRPTDIRPPRGIRAVMVSSAVPSPCLVGRIRPVIVVTPETLAEERRLRHVLLHETCHFRQKDNWFALLRGLCLILHWFNPMVWMGAAASREDCELSCDERVLRLLEPEEKLSYGETLVSSLREGRKRFSGGVVNTATAMSQSGKQIRRRIARIVKRPKTLLSATILAVLLSLCACAMTLTGAQKGESDTPQVPADSLTEPGVTPAPEQTPSAGQEDSVPAAVRAEMNEIESLLNAVVFEDMTEEEMAPYLEKFNGDFAGYGRKTGTGDAYILLQPAEGKSWPDTSDSVYSVGEVYGPGDEHYYQVDLYNLEDTNLSMEAKYIVSGVQGLEFSRDETGSYTMGYLTVSVQQPVISSAVYPYTRAWMKYAVERRLSYLQPEGPSIQIYIQNEEMIEELNSSQWAAFYIALSDEQLAEAKEIIARETKPVDAAEVEKQYPDRYRTGVTLWLRDGSDAGYQLFSEGLFASVTEEDYWKYVPDCKNDALSDWLRGIVRQIAGYDPADYDPSWFDQPLASATLSYQVLDENDRWVAKEQTVTDPEKLEKLRKLIRRAKIDMDGGCPMVFALNIVRQDGEEFSALIAGDSCATGLIHGNIWFDYGKQEDLKAIFDQDVWWE